MRTASAKVRLLALTIAVAIAVPANLPALPGADEVEPSSRADAGSLGRPTLNRVPIRSAWLGTGLGYADPSDEPDEGCDGWAQAPSPGLPAPAILPGPVADRLGVASSAVPRPPRPPGAACRLRC